MITKLNSKHAKNKSKNYETVLKTGEDEIGSHPTCGHLGRRQPTDTSVAGFSRRGRIFYNVGPSRCALMPYIALAHMQ